MWSIDQIKSQVHQLLLFSKIAPPWKLVKDALSFPFRYYGNSGIADPPLAVNLLVTSRCNLRCEMCTFSSPQLRAETELTLADIEGFIKRESQNMSHVFISGGEPFVRNDILQIVEIIKRADLTCGICTNGTLLDADKIKALIDLKIEYMVFSLLGPREIHDDIVGKTGAFDKLVENVRSFQAAANSKTKIVLNCAITEKNVHHLKAIAEIAEELKPAALRFEQLNFLTGAELMEHKKICETELRQKINVSSCLRNLEERNDFCKNIQEAQKMIHEDGAATRTFFKPHLTPAEMRSWYSNVFRVKRKCVFIWKSLFITPRGDIVPCQFLIYQLGNIKVDRLMDVWNGAKYRDFRLRLKKGLLPGCARCCKL